MSAQVTTATPKATPAKAFKKRMSNPIGSAIAIVIAVLWTLPTFGLLISSFRPEADEARGSATSAHNGFLHLQTFQ